MNFIDFDTRRLTEQEAEMIRLLPELILSADVDLSQWTVQQLLDTAFDAKCRLWMLLFNIDEAGNIHRKLYKQDDEWPGEE